MSNVCLNKPFLKEDMIQDGKRIITTLNGDRVQLNVTSMFLMSMVDNGICSVEKLQESLKNKYPNVDATMIDNDVLDVLEKMWEDFIIYFEGDNPPFEEKIDIGDNRYIEHMTLENADIIRTQTDGKRIYESPMSNLDMYFKVPDYMFLLKRKLMNAVLLFKDGHVTDYIVFEHITKTNIVAIYSESNQFGENINLLISEIQKIYKKQPVFLNITDDEDASKYEKFGFIKVGHLKKELESGDIQVLMHA